MIKKKNKLSEIFGDEMEFFSGKPGILTGKVGFFPEI